MNPEQLQSKLTKRFGKSRQKSSVFFAPGRINLIGEHLDYNGGFVLPCALSMGTYLAIRRREDHLLKFESENFSTTLEISLSEFNQKVGNEWWNYPLGVIHEFRKTREIKYGFEMLFSGDLPVGVGLSSSASIEVVTAFALNQLLNRGLTLKELALLSRRAENDFVGVQCGIMDQYAVAFGKKIMRCFSIARAWNMNICQSNFPDFLSLFQTRTNQGSLNSPLSMNDTRNAEWHLEPCNAFFS